jgi:hypothetical protein
VKVFIVMTMPAEWKNTSTNNTSAKMTLAQYVNNIKNIKSPDLSLQELSFENQLAVTASVLFQEGVSLVGTRPSGYTPTRYNFVTGEQILESQVQERQKIMSDARYHAYTADYEYKIGDLATQMDMRGNFALSYILFWKLYRIAPHIYDLPLCMEECLNRWTPIGGTNPYYNGSKNILGDAASQVRVMGQTIAQKLKYPAFIPMSRQVLTEYSQQRG